MRSPLLRKTPQVEFWFANCILAFPCLGQCLPVPGRRVVLLWFHSMPNSDVLDPRRDWNRRRLDNWRLNRRWRCRLSWWRGWCVPEIPLGHAPNSICARLGRLTQYQRQSSYVGCQENFLRIFRADLKGNGFSNGRQFGPFAGNLINC